MDEDRLASPTRGLSGASVTLRFGPVCYLVWVCFRALSPCLGTSWLLLRPPPGHREAGQRLGQSRRPSRGPGDLGAGAPAPLPVLGAEPNASLAANWRSLYPVSGTLSLWWVLRKQTLSSFGVTVPGRGTLSGANREH